MRRLFAAVLMILSLSACAAESIWAPDEAVQKARYVHGGQPSITLFTVVNNNSGNGGHAAIMINGSQRILFDPAGSWHHPKLPERNDVFYGISDGAVDFYIDYHARLSWRVVEHEIAVTPEVAQLAMKLVQEYGAVPKANCTVAVTDVLRQLPGFESVVSTMFPVPAMESFKKLPGVKETVHYDDDPDENGYILRPQI